MAGPEDVRSQSEAAVELLTEASAAAVLSAVHPALGALGAGLIEVRRAGLFPAWLRFVDQEVRDQRVDLDPHDPTLHATFHRLTQAALQTARSDKWRLLATALISTAQRIESQDFVVDHFTDLVTRFSPEHVRVLQMMVDPGRHGIDLESISPEHLLSGLVGGVDAAEREDYDLIINTVWGDLVASGLVGAGFIAGFSRVLQGALLTEEAPANLDPPRMDELLTPAGRRFLRYLGS